MVAAVPTLSTQGWVSDVTALADRLMAYFFISDYSQTRYFPGSVSSLPYLVQRHGSDPFTLRQRTRDTLYSYLSAYFDSVDIEVTTDQPAPDDPNRIQLTVKATVAKDNKTYSLGRLVSVNNNLVQKIINLNNEGNAE